MTWSLRRNIPREIEAAQHRPVWPHVGPVSYWTRSRYEVSRCCDPEPRRGRCGCESFRSPHDSEPVRSSERCRPRRFARTHLRRFEGLTTQRTSPQSVLRDFFCEGADSCGTARGTGRSDRDFGWHETFSLWEKSWARLLSTGGETLEELTAL